MGALAPLQLGISIVGVSAIVGLVAWLLGTAPARLGGAEAVRALVASEAPDLEPGAVLLDGRGSAALVQSADGREAALVFALGARPVVWRRPVARLAAVLTPAGELRLATGDFTRPALTLRLADPSQAAPLLAAARGGTWA